MKAHLTLLILSIIGTCFWLTAASFRNDSESEIPAQIVSLHSGNALSKALLALNQFPEVFVCRPPSCTSCSDIPNRLRSAIKTQKRRGFIVLMNDKSEANRLFPSIPRNTVVITRENSDQEARSIDYGFFFANKKELTITETTDGSLL